MITPVTPKRFATPALVIFLLFYHLIFQSIILVMFTTGTSVSTLLLIVLTLEAKGAVATENPPLRGDLGGLPFLIILLSMTAAERTAA